MVVVCLCQLVSLVGCGGSETESGFPENSIDDASLFVGVYTGEESIVLVSEQGSEEVSQQDNQVTIIIDEAGVLEFSTSGGSAGSAQVRNDQVFQLRSNASLQFDGQCTAEVILLEGRVSVSQVVGEYSSVGLICNQEAFRIEGQFTANR